MYNGEQDLTNPNQRNFNLIIKFFNKETLDIFQSNQKQEPIFKQVTYIEKMVIGDASSRVIRPITEQDKRDFAPQYHRFLDNKEQKPSDGFPLDSWEPIMELRDLLDKLAFNKITLVEELANISDTTAQNLDPMLRGFKYKAIDFIKNKEGRIANMEKQSKEKDEKINLLQSQLDDVIKELKLLMSERHLQTMCEQEVKADGNISGTSTTNS